MNEFELIRSLASDLGFRSDDVIRSIGDDCACVEVGGEKLLVSTDEQIEGKHFLEHFGGFGVGYKLMVSNISDILACGGIAKWITISLNIGSKTTEKWIKELYSGINHASIRYKIAVIGGNTTKSNELKIGATILGTTKRFVSRKDAKSGDLLCLSGKLGYSKAGLNMLLNGTKDHPFCDKHLFVNLPSDLQPFIENYATSAIDISDGFFADLMHIADSSGVGFELFGDEILYGDDLAKFLGSGKKAFEYALTSGEEYQLLFTIPKEHKDIAKLHNILLIGVATDRKGIFLNQKPIKSYGYTHF